MQIRMRMTLHHCILLQLAQLLIWFCISSIFASLSTSQLQQNASSAFITSIMRIQNMKYKTNTMQSVFIILIEVEQYLDIRMNSRWQCYGWRGRGDLDTHQEMLEKYRYLNRKYRSKIHIQIRMRTMLTKKCVADVLGDLVARLRLREVT